MYEQINSQVIALSKNFADTAFKAHGLAVEGFERITDLNLKTLETQIAATVGFWSEAAEVRDFDGFKAIWPKSVNLVKESSEKLYATGQEVFGVTLKTGEALGQLAKGAFDAANEAAHKQANVIQANVKKAANAVK
jgi:phasin family protein